MRERQDTAVRRWAPACLALLLAGAADAATAWTGKGPQGEWTIICETNHAPAGAVTNAVAVFFAVSVVLFLAGCALFMVDLVLAAARSREAIMGIGGLFFMAGSAPRQVQRQLLGSLAVQVLVAVVAAALDPFTPLAFGTLVPTIGLAFCGLWSVRHGLFPERTQ